ncbi:2-dehydro-3-deoxygluconokinase [Actinoplanes sp. OR16]|uniref:sugar kinase n=1 Tax=Actinoplanes sp. OR16 TaxID=946334 RepID=UPI000F6D2823|nr:sugar kinase [Actinoplanes sp. OR16]BBH70334.1 2-dehydro-3-deoxygluconokinase [Actinoplanes sp. OR16]
MTSLRLRDADSCRYDLVSLGEVMLRLDPGEGRVRTTRTFRVSEGGGEYNVARALRRVFGLRTAIVTALADNEVGRLVEDCMLTGGVDTSLVRWVPYDGVGRAVRNGLNFTERGFGVRGALGVSDRGHSAASQMKPGDVDWDHLFGAEGVRWLHTGGIFAGLSASSAAVVAEATAAARRYGTVVSYDVNYRPSLDNSDISLPMADVLLGVRDVRKHPDSVVVATTSRRVVSASRNDFGAVAWSPSTGMLKAADRPGLEVLDRVGSGDSFASGLIFGLLSGYPLQVALEYGAAHGALTMTTPGDTSMATAAEVVALAEGAGASVRR